LRKFSEEIPRRPDLDQIHYFTHNVAPGSAVLRNGPVDSLGALFFKKRTGGPIGFANKMGEIAASRAGQSSRNNGCCFTADALNVQT